MSADAKRECPFCGKTLRSDNSTEEAASLGGGLTDDTRLALRLAAAEYRAQADFTKRQLAVRCARDLDAVRAARGSGVFSR